MFRFFKELYLTAFVLGFRVSGSSWTPGLNAGKGVAGVTLIEALILMGIEEWIEILVGTRFSFNSSPWALRIASLVLYFVNYYILVTRSHGIKFEGEFNNLKKSRKAILLVSCVVMILAAITVIICSVSAYHRFFHILPKN